MNKELDLDGLVKRMKESGSYFLTATILDKDKSENNLHHYAVQKEFKRDDIIPSLDHAVRSLGIRPPEQAQVTIPPDVEPKEIKPLKIAIISHFNKAPDYYSIGRAVKNQIKMLKQFGHEVVLFVQDNSLIDWDCEIRPVVPSFKREKGIVNDDIKNKFIDVLRSELTSDFDLAITHDLYIDDCITYREAIKESGIDIKWLHWARSGVGTPIDFKMQNAKYVYMNKADIGTFANNINVNADDVRVTYNEKDPSILFDWDPITKMISNKLNLAEKDIIQIYPMCTTRMDAKGINSVIAAFGALKKLGNKVALIVCNANGHKREEEIDAKIKLALEYGLTEEDLLFTSTLASDEYQIHKEVPHRVVTELFGISNLFIFPTLAEVCSNVLLEASMTKNLLVLNEDLPSLFDFTGDNSVLSYPFTSLQSIHYSGKDKESITILAKSINGQLKSNKSDLQFRAIWKAHNTNAIYKQLTNLLYE